MERLVPGNELLRVGRDLPGQRARLQLGLRVLKDSGGHRLLAVLARVSVLGAFVRLFFDSYERPGAKTSHCSPFFGWTGAFGDVLPDVVGAGALA